MRYVLRKIRFIHVLILALFEFASLFFISFFDINTSSFSPVRNAVGGLAVGFIGTFPVMLLLNLVLKLVNVKFRGEKLHRLPIFLPCIYVSVLLALLFFIESFTAGIKAWNLLVGNAIVGFTTTPISLLIILLLYNRLPFKMSLGNSVFEKVGIKGPVIAAAVYECIALPLMALLGKGYLANPHISFALTGFISGVMGGLVAMVAHNLFLKGAIFAEMSQRNL